MMEIPPDFSFVSPILVGREAHLQTFDTLVDKVLRGQGQTMLLAGEAGVGKTRLVLEAKARALPRGLAPFEGHAFEPDRAVPFAPLADLLNRFVSALPPSRMAEDLGPHASDLTRLYPELLTLLPGLASPAPLAPEQERRRLFRALSQFILRRAASQALWIVIEDVHWSDDTSLEFLLHLARLIRAQPVLLVLTYRSDEAPSALTHLLAELDRERLATERVLAPLTREQVDAMLRAIFGFARPVRGESLDALYELTEGNPFFVEEVLKALVSAGEIFRADGEGARKETSEWYIPRSVQDAVARRVQRLSGPAQQLLALAAAAGRRFDFPVLQEQTHMSESDLTMSESDLTPLLKELVAAQLVVEESADQFAFRHALTREAAYASLLLRERKRYHRLIAETMERLYPNALDPLSGAGPAARVADLAYHYSAAGEWEKALQYSQRAGEQAQAMYAPREAVENYRRALEAARQLPPMPVVSHLHRARGQAYETLGDFEKARADYEAAWGLARAGKDRQGEWQALLDLGFLWAARDYDKTREFLEQALDLARTLDDPATLAHTLNRVGNWYVNAEQPQEGRRYHQEALGLFQRLGDRRGLAETFDLLGLASEEIGDLAHMAEDYGQAIALFRELGDRLSLSSSLASSAVSGENYFSNVSVVMPFPLAQVTAGLEEALRLAQETNWRAGESFALSTLSMCLGPQGEYERALEAAQKGLRLADEIEHWQWTLVAHMGLGMTYLDLLSLDRAQKELEAALALAEKVRSPLLIRFTRGVLGSIRVQRNDLQQAESVLNAAFDFTAGTFGEPRRVDADRFTQTVVRRHCLVALAELALARGDATQALETVERLIETAPNLTGDSIIPRLWRMRGEALTRLGRYAEGESTFVAARPAAQERGLRPMLWRLDAALGKLYQAQARRKEADREYSAARAVIAELATGITDGSLRAEFLKGTEALVPPARPATPRRAEKERFGGLTPREREVAELITQGHSNRAIAETLVLSERTVEEYVGNILAKLGFSSRTQIAAWVAEKQGTTKSANDVARRNRSREG